MHSRARLLIFGAVVALLLVPAPGASGVQATNRREDILIVGVTRAARKAIVFRNDAQAWLLHLGADCVSLARSNGRPATVEYPVRFGDTGTLLNLAEQSCRVSEAEELEFVLNR